MKVKSLYLESPGNVQVHLEEFSAIESDLAVVRVLSAGICAADKYLFSGDHPWSIEYPIVAGHEIFGEVVELPSRTTALDVGDLVTAQVKIPCMRCEFCTRSRFNLCVAGCHFGSCHKGAFSEYMRFPLGTRAHRFNAYVDPAVGALAETFANAFYCLELGKAAEASRLLILGAGSIGLAIATICRKQFPHLEIWVHTGSQQKVELLHSLGVATTASSDVDFSSIQDSFDLVVECSGYAPNVDIGFSAIKPGGKFIQYGVFRERVSVDMNVIGEFKEIQIIGGHLASDSAFAASTEFLINFPEDVRMLVTREVSFEDFASAFNPHNELQVKTIFRPVKELV